MKNMKAKVLLVAGASLFASGVWAQEQLVRLSTPETSLVIDAPQGGELKYVYYGTKLGDADLKQIDAVRRYAMPTGTCQPSWWWKAWLRPMGIRQRKFLSA